MDEAALALGDGVPGAEDAYSLALETWLALGGPDVVERAEILFEEIGSGTSLNQPMSSLSGVRSKTNGTKETHMAAAIAPTTYC